MCPRYAVSWYFRKKKRPKHPTTIHVQVVPHEATPAAGGLRMRKKGYKMQLSCMLYD